MNTMKNKRTDLQGSDAPTSDRDLLAALKQRELARITNDRIEGYAAWAPRLARERPDMRPEDVLKALRERREKHAVARSAGWNWIPPNPLQGLHKMGKAIIDPTPAQLAELISSWQAPTASACGLESGVTNVTGLRELNWGVELAGGDSTFTHSIDFDQPSAMLIMARLTDKTHWYAVDGTEMVFFAGVFNIPVPIEAAPSACEMRVLCELRTRLFMNTNFAAEDAAARVAYIFRVIDPDSPPANWISLFKFREFSGLSPLPEGATSQDRDFYLRFRLPPERRAVVQFGVSIGMTCREGEVEIGQQGPCELEIEDWPWDGIRYWMRPNE